MKSFMEFFCLLLVFLQISLAVSQSILSPPAPNLIQQVCNHNKYPQLCISSFKSDPRSLNANLEGLAAIALDIASMKVTETLTYLIGVFKGVSDPGDHRRYGTCVDEYGAAVVRHLPAASAHLKAKKYFLAINDLKAVATKPNICEEQFGGKSPVADRNMAVRELVQMAADVIKLLATAN